MPHASHSRTLALVLFAACCPPAFAEATDTRTTITGVVYLDKNANSRRDAGEPGLPGVRVSNGVDVVLTDAHGRYELPIDPSGRAILHVVKPRGYMTRLDRLNMPRSYHIHDPAGSPDHLDYPGIEPTGPLPESIDFPLYAHDEPDAFTVVTIADPQPYTIEEVGFYARDTIAELVGIEAAFAVVLGDLVGDDLDLFGPLNEVQSAVGIPFYNVHGNHDINFKAEDDTHAADTHIRTYGPTDFAFQWGSVHFIALDNVIWQGWRGYRDDGRKITNNYRGGLHDHQIEFVRNYAATVPQDEMLVVMTHIPLSPMVGDSVQHSTPERGRLFEALSNHPRTLSLSGHTHINAHAFFGSDDGYTAGTLHHHYNAVTASGSWYRGSLDEYGLPHAMMRDGAPNGYAFIDFDGTDYTIRFKASRRPADFQMTIHTPDRVTTDELAEGVELVANVFNATEKCTVELVIDGRSGVIAMDRQQGRRDPFFLAARERDRDPNTGGRGLPNPVASPHLYSAQLPADLQPGVHRLRIRWEDMFGASHGGVHVLVVR